MPEEFDSFVQDQLESFRKTCDEDFEKMKTLEQVCPLLFDYNPKTAGDFSANNGHRSSRSNSRARFRPT
ncbi:hypothetical protein IMZ48_40890 [Candidatus Bathyarchaeota archaeon]|nr:hypothetical protein [Candidatus Bathyarchaeota archaeon]